ncbi:hypothetical protein BS17DRAFT_855354 [Gyrodon lividus]|nr:hypothetical protein BS17DRAFT_855354 [Gyrodon lividus]
METAIVTIRNATFWHVMAWWKNLLEPIALMTSIHQAAHAQPEHVVISFGFLYFWYSKLSDDLNTPVQRAVLESAECQWANCDQEVFIAAVIANPFYGVAPFNKISLTTRAGLVALFGRLWLQFYKENALTELFTDLEGYLTSSGDFAYMNMYKNSFLAHSEATHTPVDALDIWSASLHPSTEPRPLHKIARCLLSICPNSASCKQLFSVFGGILTKWHNQLSMENLTHLAELKLLKCKHANVIEEKSVEGDASSCGSNQQPATSKKIPPEMGQAQLPGAKGSGRLPEA